MKKLSIFLLVMFLASCSKTVTVQHTEVIVISPPAALFDCPQLNKLPDPEKLTNQQVADVIEKLYRYNKVCGINMSKIKEYVEKAEALNKMKG